MEQETLTVTYERLRHSDDLQELSRRGTYAARQGRFGAAFPEPLRCWRLWQATLHTPVEDRAFWLRPCHHPGQTVRRSGTAVRAAVAANRNVKDHLAGRLTKDDDASVRRGGIVESPDIMENEA